MSALRFPEIGKTEEEWTFQTDRWYAVLREMPPASDNRVTDADGRAGKINVHARNGLFLLASHFEGHPTLPLTFKLIVSPYMPFCSCC